MTFIAGMVITVSTVFILSLMSSRVRTWIVEGEKLQGQLVEKQAQVDQGEKDIESINKQLTDEKEKLAIEEVKVREATERSAQLVTEADTLKVRVNNVTAQLAVSSKSLDRLQVQRDKLQVISAQLQSSNTTFYNQQKVYFEQQKIMLEQIDNYTEQIDGLSGQINNLRVEITSAQNDKIAATENYRIERERIEKERAKALADLNEATRNLATARREQSELERIALSLRDDTVRARVNRVIYNIGDELARLSVRSKLSQSEAQSYLITVLESASKDAAQKGAERAQDTRSSVAFAPLTTREGNQITADMQFDQAVGEISANVNDQVIIVRALTNAVTGEPTRIKIDVYPNPIVYNEGDVIVESRIDGTKGVQGVTQQIIEFIAKQLRERATQDGMVPAIGRQPELGEISQQELQQIVSDIVTTNRTIIMRIHAKRETRASDTLQLDVRLR